MTFSFDGFNVTDIFIVMLTAAAVYGAIRQDLKNIHEKIARAQAVADEAHKRIDSLLIGNNHHAL
jgi:hypothetical protein